MFQGVLPSMAAAAAQLSEGPAGGRVCHGPSVPPGWDPDVDQIVCVPRIELAEGFCRVSYLGTRVIKSIV